MQKKLVIVINVIVLVIVIFVSVFMAWEAFSEADVVASEECIDVNNVASFVYESCYDAYTQAIFLKVRRSFDTYRLNAFEFSFFDFSEQSYKIVDVPDIGESRAYKIPSEKNSADP